MIPSDYSQSQIPSTELLTDLWLSKIYHDTHDGKFSRNEMFTGGPRVGKSMAACNFMLSIDEHFSVDDVVYTPEQFYNRVNEIEATGRIGKGIVPDEMGTMMSSREWYSVTSKALNFTLQTAGYLRPIIFFIAPDFSYIDSQPKKLFNRFNEVSRRTYSKYSTIKPFDIQIDRKKGKMYFHYPRFMIKDHGLVKLHRIKVYGTPPEDFVKEYEQKSYPYKKALREKMEEIIKNDRKDAVKSGEEWMTEEDIVEKILEKPEHYSRRGRIDKDLVVSDFKVQGKKIGRDMAYTIKKVVERELAEKR